MDLIPRRNGKQCPKNTVFREGLGTCSCEDHCGWDVCRLVKAPNECISETFGEWQWDRIKNGWVAQVVLGSSAILRTMPNETNSTYFIHHFAINYLLTSV